MLLAQGAGNDTGLQDFVATIDRERRAGNTNALDALETAHGLPPELDRERFIDIVWTVTAPEIYDRFVRRCGWTHAMYAAWLAEALVAIFDRASADRRSTPRRIDHAPPDRHQHRVDREAMLDFVRPRHSMVLDDAALPTAGRRPRPVTGGVDEQGRIVISTYPERAKTANARRGPQVSVLVLSDDFGGEWVQVDGDCEVIDLPDSVEPLVDYFRAISGEHPDWDEYRQAMRDQGKSLLRVTPTRWGPVATGGFPARLA